MTLSIVHFRVNRIGAQWEDGTYIFSYVADQLIVHFRVNRIYRGAMHGRVAPTFL
jgi:hypothetical protein